MPTILVVDDSAVERRLIAGLLEQNPQLQVETADNGRAALEVVRTGRHSLVLTDLRMPEIDGLTLVREMAARHPETPVILMTAHGNETLALEALRSGAATYIPKAHMDEMLLESIQHVLAMRDADRTATDLMQSLDELDYEFELESDPALIEPLVHVVQQAVSGMQFGEDTQRLQMGVALEQALLHALYRGNLEITAEQMEQAREDRLRGGTDDPVAQRRGEAPYSDRKIFVRVTVDADSLRFIVRHEGPGLDAAPLAEWPVEAFSDIDGGRGFVLMKALMDDVTSGDQGKQLTLIKYRSAERLERSTDR